MARKKLEVATPAVVELSSSINGLRSQTQPRARKGDQGVRNPVRKPSVNSRAKGAAAERELANIFKEQGYEARRGQQRAGGPDSPDVVGLLGIHVEAKRVEQLRLHAAVAQARRDAGANMPAVFHRRSRDGWLVTVGIDDFLALHRAWVNQKGIEDLL